MYIPATTLTQTGLIAQAETLIDQQPEKYSMGGGNGLKSAAAAVKAKMACQSSISKEHFAVLNASRVAAARATEGFLECRHAGCHRAVARSGQKKRKTTCGKTNCPKA
eukprot:COSAG05_NODE_243_length_13035_cov_115.270022_7_plen_108_part_00